MVVILENTMSEETEKSINHELEWENRTRVLSRVQVRELEQIVAVTRYGHQ